MKLNDVVYPIVEQIAQKLEKEHHFAQDPELYTVALLLEAKRNLKTGNILFMKLELAMSEENVEEARKLLKRKKVTTQ